MVEVVARDGEDIRVIGNKTITLLITMMVTEYLTGYFLCTVSNPLRVAYHSQPWL